ncbi:MAG: hypothetical protein WCL14_09805 [Bacteroidota bacterium]
MIDDESMMIHLEWNKNIIEKDAFMLEKSMIFHDINVRISDTKMSVHAMKAIFMETYVKIPENILKIVE